MENLKENNLTIVLYIHSLAVGGAEKIVSDYAIRLKNGGCKVIVLVNYRVGSIFEQNLIRNDVMIISIFPFCNQTIIGKILNKLFFEHLIYKKINSILNSVKPDIIHVHTSLSYLRKVSFPKERMLFTFHCDISRYISIMGKEEYVLIKNFSKQGMIFTALTEYMKNSIKNVFETNKILLLPNGVDIKKILSSTNNRYEWCKRNDIPLDSYLICNIARFNEVKNHERLINIFYNLLKYKPNAYLILIGGDDNGRINKIKNKINDLGITDKVLFLGVLENVASILKCMDVFVLTSLSESFSLSTLEAQVLGLKCVVSDGIPKDIICNSNCKRISLEKDDSFWVKAILENEENKVIQNLEVFDQGKIVKKLVQIYKKIKDGVF